MTILNPDEGREGGRAALYTPDTLAERWGCSGRAVIEAALSGQLRAFRIMPGDQWIRIHPEAADQYVATYGKPIEREGGELGSLVYFIRCGAFVKIGKAYDAQRRLKGLQIGSPHVLELLATEPGHLAREGDLHHRFKHLRHRGEWFRYKGDLARYIKGLAK